MNLLSNDFNHSNPNSKDDQNTNPTSHNQDAYGSQDPYASYPAFSNAMPEELGPKKQSGLGIASFILSLVSLLLLILSIVFAVSFTSDIIASDLILTDPNDTAAIQNYINNFDEEMLVPIMLAGLFILGSIGIAFIGLILGIIAVFNKQRKKVFAIIGIVLNGILVFGAIFLFVIGLAFSAVG